MEGIDGIFMFHCIYLIDLKGLNRSISFEEIRAGSSEKQKGMATG